MDYCGRVIANESVTIISLETTWVKRMKQLKIAEDEMQYMMTMMGMSDVRVVYALD